MNTLESVHKLQARMGESIIGQESVIEQLTIGLLANGNILMEGLAAYPQSPQVSDKTSRGDLTGDRIDSIIWVVEKPGTYDIPGIRFQWWDPDQRELKQQVIHERLHCMNLPVTVTIRHWPLNCSVCKKR